VGAVAGATDEPRLAGDPEVRMTDRPLRVAVVSRDPVLRLEAARAFDGAPVGWDIALHNTMPADADVVVLAPDVRGEGVRFDPSCPQLVVEEIARLTSRADVSTTAITSASRGTGVTSLALHLAAAHASLARPCCFFDLDATFGAARRLGIPGQHLTWRDVGSSGASLALAALPVAGGFNALLSPGDGENPENAGELLERAETAFSRVVIDLPPGRLRSEVLGRGRTTVVVMAPTLDSAARTVRLIAQNGHVNWLVVTNRMGPGGETTRRELEQVLERPIALELPCAPALRDAAENGKLLTSKIWRYTRAVASLQRALENS
jgi:MinD-like ATPase involved in chromosome partitioning or flagellar assembly